MNNDDEEHRADYWKSNERKYCDFCKCWIADNKPSVQFHENGKRHKANVAKRITEISKKSAKDEKAKQKFDMEIRKMEDAAMKAYMKDIGQYADMSSQTMLPTEEGDNEESSVIGPQLEAASSNRMKYTPKVDPLLQGLPADVHEDDYTKARKKAMAEKAAIASTSSSSCQSVADQHQPENSLWCEAITDEGHTYYWNVKTNESIWEAPKEGYMTLKEYNKINEQAKLKQQEALKNESHSLIKNADEIVAKYRREENFKKYAARTARSSAAATGSGEDETSTEYDNIKCDPEILARDAQPYGQWKTIVKVEKKMPDLELPQCGYYHQPPVVTEIQPKPVKEFKERKVELLDPELTASTPGFFKKRKLGGASRNTRQRLDDE